MAWSWSHTVEAYENARRNLGKLRKGELNVIYAEWEAHTSREEDEGAFDEPKYKAALTAARKIPADILADAIWERAEELATCDNGGFNAWVCPFGCHTVSFD